MGVGDMPEQTQVKVKRPLGHESRTIPDHDEQRLRHDVRQSLAALMLMSSLIDKGRMDDPALAGRLELMRHEIDWMAAVLAPPAPVNAMTLVDLGRLTDEIWGVVAECRRCSMRLVKEPALVVVAEPIALGRSVRNLIENGVRAAGPAGEVEVRVTSSCGSVTVEVADSGPGFGRIPAQERLGLLTVHRFAAEHGGEVLVGDSNLGGASVRLVLPLAAPRPMAQATRTSA
jgi:signal transduction histidine kinase